MLYTTGYPKITGSLILKIPGANPNLAILFDALFLLNKNVTSNNTIDLLLQKRSKEKDSFPGCYDISSAGHISAGDEPLESAIRELNEELGIQAEKEQLKEIGIHKGIMNGKFYEREFKNHEISRVYIYEEPIDIAELKLQKEEVEEVMWMDSEELLEKVRKGEIENCLFEDEILICS